MLSVEILGGVGEYGRNCFYIENQRQAILLDCGIMKDTQKTPPNITSNHIEKLAAVFISHSHIDHVGGIAITTEHGLYGTDTNESYNCSAASTASSTSPNFLSRYGWKMDRGQ